MLYKKDTMTFTKELQRLIYSKVSKLIYGDTQRNCIVVYCVCMCEIVNILVPASYFVVVINIHKTGNID